MLGEAGGGWPDRNEPLDSNPSSNGCGNIRGVIYGLEEMALLEHCHAWAIWFTVMTATLVADMPAAGMERARLKPSLILIIRGRHLPVLLEWGFFKYHISDDS